ncbi:hypothetical protein JKP88DRAFT_241749 [Tribonema minus]|uniref:C2H2-type domain-containing protein n=1 Tax=Tribonema minus TaxID=303371 RepID=A0A835YRF2_9STRA|nr:hypothetical protein JKP88DRAFT_241749 [Tribonema minus]
MWAFWSPKRATSAEPCRPEATRSQTGRVIKSPIKTAGALRLTTVYLVDFENGCQKFVPAECFILGSPTCEDPAAVTSAVILFKAPFGRDADAAGTISDYWRSDTLVRVATCFTTNPEAADTHLVLAASSLMSRPPGPHPALQGLLLAPPEELNVRLVHGGDRRYGELGASLLKHGNFKSFGVMNGTRQRLGDPLAAPTAGARPAAAAVARNGGAGAAAPSGKRRMRVQASGPSDPREAFAQKMRKLQQRRSKRERKRAAVLAAQQSFLHCRECSLMCASVWALRAHMHEEHRDQLCACARCAAAAAPAAASAAAAAAAEGAPPPQPPPPLLFTAEELTAHMAQRHREYVCFTCARVPSFAMPFGLHAHQRALHGYTCPVCGERCLTLLAAAAHLRQTHSHDALGVWAPPRGVAAAADKSKLMSTARDVLSVAPPQRRLQSAAEVLRAHILSLCAVRVAREYRSLCSTVMTPQVTTLKGGRGGGFD